MIKAGDKVEFIAYENQDKPWEKNFGAEIGGVYEVDAVLSNLCIAIFTGKKFLYVSGFQLKKIVYMPNRKKLAEFIKVNNIKMTKVSQTLGKARNWLHVMTTEKRRGDLSDKQYALIMDKLHIDWSKDQVIKVKATKEHTAYTTRTSSYKTVAHKDRLQRAMWNGEFVV